MWSSYSPIERVAVVLLSPIWAPIGLVVIVFALIFLGIALGFRLLFWTNG